MGVRLRLFCFRHAGGSGAAFFGWQRRLGPAIDVVPVEFPRHCTNMAEMADLLSVEVAGQAGPFAFYGHSMGALAAYHVARLLVHNGGPRPLRLLAGSFPAPHLPHGLAAVVERSDDRLLDVVAGAGALPPLLHNDLNWRAQTVRALRADLAMCATGRLLHPIRPLPCPIDVFVGASDPLVSARDATAWAVHAGAGLRVHTLAGGHFFVRESKEEFFRRLSRVLARTLSPGVVYAGRAA
jgi:surfactin synthase thioesterase subunit